VASGLTPRRAGCEQPRRSRPGPAETSPTPDARDQDHDRPADTRRGLRVCPGPPPRPPRDRSRRARPSSTRCRRVTWEYHPYVEILLDGGPHRPVPDRSLHNLQDRRTRGRHHQGYLTELASGRSHIEVALSWHAIELARRRDEYDLHLIPRAAPTHSASRSLTTEGPLPNRLPASAGQAMANGGEPEHQKLCCRPERRERPCPTI
jgi:hypothetical protein